MNREPAAQQQYGLHSVQTGRKLHFCRKLVIILYEKYFNEIDVENFNWK
jgi:hypothetical protein